MCVWPPLQSPCSFFQTLSCLDNLYAWNSTFVLPSKGVENFIAAPCRGFCLKTLISDLFRCRIRWEFESPVIPLLSKIAPSDVILVRRLPADSAFAKAWGCERNVPKQRRNHSSHAGYLSKGSRGVACVWTQPWPPGKEAWRN